jgi:cell wall-associated NlpC family hydrolase
MNDVMQVTRADVVAEARTWLGTKWVHQHRTKGVAVDCAGLVIGVARELGLVPPCFDFNGYTRSPDGTLLAVCEQYMRRIPREQMQPGDVVVVSVSTDPQHMGIVAPYVHGGLSIIHATSAGQRCVVETRLSFNNIFRYRAAFSLPGVLSELEA